MKHKKTALLAGCILIGLGLFVGCGKPAGEKEFTKAMQARRDGDPVRARTLLEKTIRKTSSKERQSIAWNQLGIILWQLDEIAAATDAFEKSCSLSSELSMAHLNLGYALYHTGRYDEAELMLNTVTGNDPNNTTAQALLSLIEMQRNNWREATDSVQQALKSNPSDSAALTALAVSELHAVHQPDTAIARLKQVLNKDKKHAPAAYNLAVIYERWKADKTTAMQWYERYIELAGDSGYRTEAASEAIARLSGKRPTNAQTGSEAANRYMTRGTTEYAAQNYSVAIAQYQKAIEAAPQQKNAYYNMGLAHYSLKKYPEAIDACLNALRIDPAFSDARYMLALSYFQQSKWKEAEHEARILRKTDPARADKILGYIAAKRK